MERITSRQNPRIKEIRALAARRPQRLGAGLAVVEGPRWLAALVRAGRPVVRLLVRDDALQDEAVVRQLAALPPATELLQVTEEVMAAASPSRSPQGLLAVVPLAAGDLEHLPAGIWAVANGLQDPGNLGAVMRSAAAFRAAAVLCTPGTVDWRHPAVLRAATPAMLRVTMVDEVEPQRLLTALEARGGALLVTAARGGRPPADLDWRGTRALVLGHEVRGVDPVLGARATGAVTVPMPGGVDSLNVAVATGIILYEASRSPRDGARGPSGKS